MPRSYASSLAATQSCHWPRTKRFVEKNGKHEAYCWTIQFLNFVRNNICRFVSGQEPEECAVPTCAKFAFACEFGSSNSMRRVYEASHNATVSIHQVIQFLNM